MHELLAWIVHHFGAAGVGLAAGLEGETAVVVGGGLARHGAFSPIAAAVAAWLGSFVADQLFFGLGRWRREGAWVKRVAAKPYFTRALKIIERHPIAFCVAFRFVYGFRVVGPVAIGVSVVPARLFLLLNCLSAAAWAVIFTALGYRFGPQVERFLQSLLTPGHLGIAIGAAAALVAALLVWRQRQASHAPIEPIGNRSDP